MKSKKGSFIMLKLAFTNIKDTKIMMILTGTMTLILSLFSYGLFVSEETSASLRQFSTVPFNYIKTNTLVDLLITLVLPSCILFLWYALRYILLLTSAKDQRKKMHTS
jgi:hypothetical protein